MVHLGSPVLCCCDRVRLRLFCQHSFRGLSQFQNKRRKATGDSYPACLVSNHWGKTDELSCASEDKGCFGSYHSTCNSPALSSWHWPTCKRLQTSKLNHIWRGLVLKQSLAFAQAGHSSWTRLTLITVFVLVPLRNHRCGQATPADVCIKNFCDSVFL